LLDFLTLGKEFYTPIQTQPLKEAFLVHQNQDLYRHLKLDFDTKSWLKIASGEVNFKNITPIASVYSGHQFGQFAGQLGDGRSCLIGQINQTELSLKGAGKTPYSRGGDGRAVLRSSIREYLCSIAMVGLGIPTTQALTLVGSQSEVYREEIETGAIVMRSAQSHIRFGHFEHFAVLGQNDSLKKLTDFVIMQYFPACLDGDVYANFLSEVVKLTAKMIAHWQAQGFVHGVMNTDNMSILGLTIDYGPFGFLEDYQPNFVCNHSDYQARYAFDKQPSVGLWNLSRLADALSSLLSRQKSQKILQTYQAHLVAQYTTLMRKKFGLFGKNKNDNQLIGEFFKILHTHQKDHTNSLRGLADLAVFSQDVDFKSWLKTYQKRLDEQDNTHRKQTMDSHNPKFILRNYLAEVAIQKAQQKDYGEINTLFDILKNPFSENTEFETYAKPAPNWARHLKLSCSS
jgi:uncharacterized protein YdiU (UPF0061 family)